MHGDEDEVTIGPALDLTQSIDWAVFSTGLRKLARDVTAFINASAELVQDDRVDGTFRKLEQIDRQLEKQGRAIEAIQQALVPDAPGSKASATTTSPTNLPAGTRSAGDAASPPTITHDHDGVS